MPGMAGGANAKAIASGTSARSVRLSVARIACDGEAGPAPLVPGLERDEEEGGVGGRGAREQAEAVDGGDERARPCVSFSMLLDLPRDLVRALERRGVGELHVHEQEALVLLGDEAGRQAPPEAAREQREAGRGSAGPPRSCG